MPRHTLLVVAAVLCATCDALRLGPLAARTLTRIGAHAADVAAPLTLETLPLAPLDAVNAHQSSVMRDIAAAHAPTPLEVVARHHAELSGDIEDAQTTPLELVDRYHGGLAREFRATEGEGGTWSVASLLRSAWSRGGPGAPLAA